VSLREAALAASREWNTNAQALAEANQRFLAALEATGRTFDDAKFAPHNSEDD
jgi:hypothetical protein